MPYCRYLLVSQLIGGLCFCARAGRLAPLGLLEGRRIVHTLLFALLQRDRCCGRGLCYCALVPCPRRPIRMRDVQVEVTGSFELVGQPFALLLARLGLPMDTLVKVRRRSHPDGLSGKPFPLGRTGVDSCGTDSSHTAGAVDEDEESNRIGWASRVAGTAAAGGDSRVSGMGPFALRRRSPYVRLEAGASDGDRPTRGSDAAAPCIEMAKIQTSGVGGKAGDDAASCAGGGATEEKVDNSNNSNSSSGKDADDFEDIYGVSTHSTIQSGDVLVLSCARDAMVHFQGSLMSQRRRGLKVLGVSTLILPRHGTVLFELVLSRQSGFLGRTAGLDNAFFAEYYGCSVVAVRLKGGTETRDGVVDVDEGSRFVVDAEGVAALGTPMACAAPKGGNSGATAAVGGIGEAVLVDAEDAATVADSPLLSTTPTPLLSSPVGGGARSTGEGELQPMPAFGSRRRRRRGAGFAAGDTVIVVAMEGFLEKASSTGEFLSKERLGRLPEPTGWFHVFPLMIFAAMLAWVLFVRVDMVRWATLLGLACCWLFLVSYPFDHGSMMGHSIQRSRHIKNELGGRNRGGLWAVAVVDWLSPPEYCVDTRIFCCRRASSVTIMKFVQHVAAILQGFYCLFFLPTIYCEGCPSWILYQANSSIVLSYTLTVLPPGGRLGKSTPPPAPPPLPPLHPLDTSQGVAVSSV